MQLHPDTQTEIKRIFNWFGEQEITDTQGQTYKVYIRLVGDDDATKARVYALRKSNELRKKLRDPESDEYNAVILPVEFLENEQLIAEILQAKLIELYQQAGKEVRHKYPKEPAGDADLAEQEKYQTALDNWQSELNKKIEEWIEPRYSKLMFEYGSKLVEDLRRECRIVRENNWCSNEFQLKFKDMCTYSGTFSDVEMKESFFSSIEEFNNLRTEVKTQFIDFYSDLDLSTEELKK